MTSTPPIETVLAKTVAEVERRRSVPTSTYRFQFHAGFTFRAAAELVPYLSDLGISHLYASPYLKARPGSQHGYDICDHRSLNPEIGSEDDYTALIGALHAHGMGHILDMVPNHMGIVGNENAWWNDLLENGPASPYASYFDIDWHSSLKPELREKVLLPMLGKPYGEALETGELKLARHAGAFEVSYFQHRFPVAPDTYDLILEPSLPDLERQLSVNSLPVLEYQSILTAIKHLPRRSDRDPARMTERLREKEVIKRRLGALAESSEVIKAVLDRAVAVCNGSPGEPRSFDRLHHLLDAQAYRLSFWRVASDEINYRRFFDVNELAALSMERPDVFADTHQLVMRLIRAGKINGLRIDHPDGLFDPAAYFRRLQRQYALECARAVVEAEDGGPAAWDRVKDEVTRAIDARAEQGEPWLQRPLYVLVEKILGRGEPLPPDWPVHGTTGYEFLNHVNGLFVDPTQALAFDRIYRRFTGVRQTFAELVHDKKFLIMQISMSSELHVLAQQFDRLSERDRFSRDFTLNTVRHALREVIACFPVYRSYVSDCRVSELDHKYILTAVARAKRANRAMSPVLFDYIRDLLVLNTPPGADPGFRPEQCRLAGKFQQVTSPVMAKGMEDTSFYVYNRLVSLNEVGGAPEQFGVSVPGFHAQMRDRQARWPDAMSATATHDTKRGEDTRARINVLSEMPREWRQALHRWTKLNRKYHVEIEGRFGAEDQSAPDRNEEYFLYQTLIGAWPLDDLSAAGFPAFVGRIQAYVQKAIHEAKVNTSWINPNPPYDEAMQTFVAAVLDRDGNRAFVEDIDGFARRVAHFGFFNSLSQTLVKLTAPGNPDVYQGTEVWDFSLVDPDNRRPVDYGRRRSLLGEVQRRAGEAGADLPGLARELVAAKEDGRVKLYITWRSLRLRREQPGLFAKGEYVPTTSVGSRGDNVIAFGRRVAGRQAITVVPRLITRLVDAGGVPVGDAVWGDTALFVPGISAGEKFRDEFTGEVLTAGEADGHGSFRLGEVLRHFPVALLVSS